MHASSLLSKLKTNELTKKNSEKPGNYPGKNYSKTIQKPKCLIRTHFHPVYIRFRYSSTCFLKRTSVNSV